MGGAIAILLFLHLLLLFHFPYTSFPLRTDSRAPFVPRTPLVFCPLNGSVCCDPMEDLRLQKLFQTMNIPDLACASLLKSVLCAKCDKISAELFKTKSKIQVVPLLCSAPKHSRLSKSATNDFCGEVWESCQNMPLLNSPFVSSTNGRRKVPVNSTFVLNDLWQSKNDFREAFCGSSDEGEVCFDGKYVSLPSAGTPPPKGMCLERIAKGAYLDMVAHPDGSNRAFLGNLNGKIWLATVPEEGSGETMVFNESDPFLDISDMVHFETQFGLKSMAFHPNFTQNGRFFVSFNCDKLQWSGCSVRCSCDKEHDCDPSKLGSHNGDLPCQYSSVIAEFSANDSTLKPHLATRANPYEIRRIFTMDVYGTAPGGQILFGPDGYLYCMIGDDGVYNFAQNKKSLRGKILRVDIDNLPSEKEMSDLNIWGNYSIPRDNPYFDDKALLPEIWALGFRNPWRCRFDSERPIYFICGDCGQDQYEEVDIITKGGNYGWRFYEGKTSIDHRKFSGTRKSVGSLKLISPVMGYDHSAINSNEGSAAITGGYFYRSKTDPCMYDRYLYADLYGGAIWAGSENPKNSGNFTTAKLSFSCARDSPVECRTVAGSSLLTLGYVFSMGQDNKEDIFLLTSNGVLRIVRPSRCNYTCSGENLITHLKPNDESFTSTGSISRVMQNEFPLTFFLLLLLDFTLQYRIYLYRILV